MGFKIGFFNGLNDKRVEEKEKLLLRVAEFALTQEGYQTGELSIALVDDEDMQRLNNEYRGLNETTDVLSFPLGEDDFGEIIISWSRAKEQAREFGHSLDRELGFLLVHGILHLLGYDHQKEDQREVMRGKEEEILSRLELDREDS